MHLITSNTKLNPKNTFYPNVVKILNKEQLLEAIKFDHCASLMENGYRKNENWVGSDCIMVDVDNQNNEVPYTIEQALYDFRRYKCFIVPSKSHLKEKNGKIVERFHIYFPIKQCLDPERYLDMVSTIAHKAHNDGDCLDLSRYFNGIEGVEVFQTEGRRFIDDAKFMKEIPRDPIKRKIILVQGAPGTGKTFVQNKLKEFNYKIFKTCSTMWISALLTGSDSWQHALRIDKDTICTRTFCTILIDECSLLSIEDLEIIKRKYPYCNIVVFGDWNQHKLIEGTSIYQENLFDEIYELDTYYRTTDMRLIKLLDAIRTNNWDYVKSIIAKRQSGSHDNANIISFTNEAQDEANKLFSLGVGSKIIGFNKMVFSSNKPGWRPNYEERKFANMWWKNNEMFEILEKGADIIKIKSLVTLKIGYIKKFQFDNYFTASYGLTSHKVQGLTLKKVVVNISDFQTDFDLDRLARSLYVACSRVKSIDDLTFIGELTITPHLDSYNLPTKKLSSDELIEYLLSIPNLNIEDVKAIKKETAVCDTLLPIINNGETGVTKSESSSYHFLGTPLAGDELTKGFLDDNSEIEDLLELIDYSKGHRNKALCTIIGQLKKKKDKGYIKDLKAAFDYANSIIGCEEAEEIWKRYG
jgi:hypothetical protein